MNGLVLPATALAMLGTGLFAGFLFAFSNVVMPSLGRQEPPAAIRTMQTINIVVGNGLFAVLLIGTTLLAIVLGGFAIANISAAGAPLLLVGSTAFLLVGIGVTGIFNVPMNRRLARVDPLGRQNAQDWSRFETRWVVWNHIRTAGSALACLAYGLALVHL